MKLRKRRTWFEWFKKMAGPICVVAAVMLITAITFTAHGGSAFATDTSAAQDQSFVQTSAPDDIAGLAITDTAIAADTARIARQEGIQIGADQSVPIAAAVAPDIAGKEIDIATTIEQIRHAALAPTFQPFALVVS